MASFRNTPLPPVCRSGVKSMGYNQSVINGTLQTTFLG